MITLHRLFQIRFFPVFPYAGGCLLAGLGLAFSLGTPIVWADEVARVIVVVNQNQSESVELGEYYADRRNIPPANIIRLSTSDRESINWRQFVETIHNPLFKRLMEDGWIDGELTGGEDHFGRHRALVFGHRISYLVICRGIPLRVNHDGSRVSAEEMEKVHRQLRTTRGAVDSELALLAWPGYPVQGVVSNPLFNNPEATRQDHQRVLKVSRLDGPTHEVALGLVDGALEGERSGLLGRAYIDLLGANPIGQKWLAEARDDLRELGFDLSVHDGRGVFPLNSRFDSPVIYFGWYAGRVTGPFTLEGFRFPSGSIAYHIHSGSGVTLRSDSRHWTGPLLARGATVSFGSVFEPYIELIHNPQLVLKKLRGGATVGEAAAYAVPVFSWQSIVVGDPLYRPFAVSLEEQLADFETDPHLNSAYAVVRQMNLLASERSRDRDAIAFGKRAFEHRPDLFLGLALAERQAAARDRQGARATLEAMPSWNISHANQTGLVRDAIALLAELGGHEKALGLYEKHLAGDALPQPLREEWLEAASALAERSRDRDRASLWRAELERLRAEAAAAETDLDAP